ncbi:MAG: penicillin-binding protein 2, partial [Ilumatobacter sp.]
MNDTAAKRSSAPTVPPNRERVPVASKQRRTSEQSASRRRTSPRHAAKGSTGRSANREADRGRRSGENHRRISAPRPEIRAHEAKSGSPRTRLIVALVVLSLLLVAIVVRVTQLKTSDAESFRSAGAAQWTRTRDIVAQRGTIFDRHGNELAMSVPAAAISINPKLVENGPATVQMLDDFLDLPDDKVADLLVEVNRPLAERRGFVYVARQVDAEVGQHIEALNRAGINVDDESRREMPGGLTGQTVLGRTNIDGAGIAGLELQYDDVLTGTGGQMTREIAPGGRTIAGSETITASPVAGDDLVLTIDRSIQFATEQILIEQVTNIDARGGFIIVMDSDTGEIYANSSVRRDPDTDEPMVTGANFVALDSYEPGSVAKVITVAGALDAGAVTPATTFEVPWREQYYDDLLKDSHEHDTEVMTVEDILVESSNIGTIKIQETMGRFVHHDYMTAFGLGEKTALDFPDESPGIFKAADELWGSERVTVAYGQGMSSTPLQMAAAINTIANDGVYVAPRLVAATVGPDGTTTAMPPSETRRVVSSQAASQTAAMMQEVVCNPKGTAKLAAVPGLPIAGKTGTAFKAAANGTYYDDNGDRIYYASFAGFFPADDPQVTV